VKIVSDIDKYLTDLETMGIKKEGDLGDKKTFYAVSMVMMSLINGIIDLGQEIVIARKFGMPSTYKDVFRILQRNKVISMEELRQIEPLIGLRNTLSHEYFVLTEARLFDAVCREREIKIISKKLARAIK